MSGKQRRLQRERRAETFKLMQEARRDKYKGVIELPRTRRGELVNICRSNGGGVEPYDYNAAYDLVSNGYAKEHKNLNGHFIATAKGNEIYKILFNEMTT